MNENEPFIPKWAESELNKAPNHAHELEMLRTFYQAWEALHSITGDKRNPETRKKYETAAQALVDAAHPLRVLNGN